MFNIVPFRGQAFWPRVHTAVYIQNGLSGFWKTLVRKKPYDQGHEFSLTFLKWLTMLVI